MRVTLRAIALSSAVAAALFGGAATAEDTTATDLSSMVTDGKVNFDFRYRYEFVDQDGIDKDANASTLRSRLSYRSVHD
jgi:hypothetical protein